MLGTVFEKFIHWWTPQVSIFNTNLHQWNLNNFAQVEVPQIFMWWNYYVFCWGYSIMIHLGNFDKIAHRLISGIQDFSGDCSVMPDKQKMAHIIVSRIG